MRRLAPLLTSLALALTPVSGRAQFSLTEVTAANAIGQGMQAGNAGAATGAANPATTDGQSAAATDKVGIGGVKYIPAYAIVLMLVGLSTFVVCRPARRHAAD